MTEAEYLEQAAAEVTLRAGVIKWLRAVWLELRRGPQAHRVPPVVVPITNVVPAAEATEATATDIVTAAIRRGAAKEEGTGRKKTAQKVRPRAKRKILPALVPLLAGTLSL